MSLTDNERAIIFQMIQEGGLSAEQNQQIRTDDVLAREVISAYKELVLPGILRTLPHLEAAVIQAQDRVDELQSQKELLENV